MKKNRVRILGVYIVLVLLLSAAAILTAFGLHSLREGLDSMQEIADEYIDLQDAVHNMREASDFLTEKARIYVVNADQADLDAYLDEINTVRRRDNALETLRQYQEHTGSYEALAAALNSSNALAEVELYAMLLTAEGSGMPEADLETRFPDTVLSAEDEALAPEAKKAKAVTMMFDENYDRLKDRILEESYDSLEQLVNNIRGQQLESYSRAMKGVRELRVILLVILFAMVLTLFLTALLVIMPLSRGVRYIRESKPLPLGGAAEYVYLAETYNRMLHASSEQKEQLSYEATHDALTGLFNRKVFERSREESAGSEYALLIVDVDRFKEINDTNGHDTGDRVLKAISGILMDSFRSEDAVCRIGGDEFAVIMKNMTPALRSVAENKITSLRTALACATGLPHTTISIGAAFSGEADEKDVFLRADEALYSIKQAGGDGYAFYETGLPKKSGE